MNAEKLLAYAKAPGLATLEQTLEVKEFLTKFHDMLSIYRAAYGEPLGLGVESNLKNVDWYVNYHTPSP